MAKWTSGTLKFFLRRRWCALDGTKTVEPGDGVTVTGRPGKYEQHIMWLEYLVTSDGRKLGRNPQSMLR